MARTVKITVVDKLAGGVCHHGHKIGDSFDYRKDRGTFCPMALHAGFPYIEIMLYGGNPPKTKEGEVCFCCPDCDVLNKFKLELVKE